MADYSDVTAVLYSHEWLFLLAAVAIAVIPWFASTGVAPGTNRFLYNVWRFTFYGLIGFGIFFWYWSTAVHWYHAHSVAPEGVDDPDDDDDDTDNPGFYEPDGSSLHLEGAAPRILAPDHMSKGTFVATWVLILVGLLMFKIETAMLEFRKEIDTEDYGKVYAAVLIPSILIHVAITVLFFFQSAYAAGFLYSAAALILLVPLSVYFFCGTQSWNSDMASRMRTARLLAAQKRRR